jgi:hypothetical protein
MTLPEKILAGLATDAEVAEALGIVATIYNGDWIGPPPPPEDLIYWPALTTCLTTLAAECERRGMAWYVGSNGGACVSKCGDNYPAKSKDPALALCAALVAAVMEMSDG